LPTKNDKLEELLHVQIYDKLTACFAGCKVLWLTEMLHNAICFYYYQQSPVLDISHYLCSQFTSRPHSVPATSTVACTISAMSVHLF